MNPPIIALASLLLAVLSLLLLVMVIFLGVEKATTPQLLTLSALWLAPLVFALLKVKEAGALNGLIAGCLGALLVQAEIHLLLEAYPDSTLLTQLSGKASTMIFILGGFWGGAAGIISDNARLVKAKRAARKQAQKKQG